MRIIFAFCFNPLTLRPKRRFLNPAPFAMNAPIPAFARLSRPLTWLTACTMLFALSSAVAQTTYVWTGMGYDNWADDPGNWENDTPPPFETIPDNTDITDAILRFGDNRRTYVQFGELYAHRLEIVGHTRPYNFAGFAETLHLGSGGILYDPATPKVWSLLETPVQLHADQTWDIRSGTLEVRGWLNDAYYDEGTQSDIYSGHTLTKTGEGNLALMYMFNNWSGGVNLNAGRLTIPGPSIGSLGLGPLVFNGGTLAVEEYYDFEVEDFPAVLVNDVVSNGLLSFHNNSELVILPLDFFLALEGETQTETMPVETDGTLTLNADTTLRVEGAPLFVGLDVVEAGGSRKLTVDGNGVTVLFGSSGWTGGTQVDKGGLIFAGEGNTPGTAEGILVNANGYVGIGVANNIGGFLSEIDPTSTGFIGFDTPPAPDFFDSGETEPVTDVFGSPQQGIVLSNLPNVRLGSASEAIIDGVITPAGTDYRFGGGGGYLFVNSPLTGARSVSVSSLPERPLTVILGNDAGLTLPTNTFDGGVTVQNSALVFMSGTQPAAGAYTLQTGGYIGLMDSNQTAQTAFLTRFPGTTNTGIIGFDYLDPQDTGMSMDVSIPLNFAAYQPGVYFGTHTDVLLSGTITPAADNTYRFAGYKGGTLEVAGQLTGGNAVHIGDPNSLGTFGSPVDEEISSVILSGDNNYTGTTTLYTGRLGVDQTNGSVGIDPTTALGTGALLVQPHNLSLPGEEGDDFYPLLTAQSYGMIIPNDLVLNNGLEIGGYNSFTLAGNISGAGELYLGSETFEDDYYTTQESGGYQLTLSGDNANFSGGIYVGYGTSLRLTTDTAAGTGPLGFGYSGEEYYNFVEFSSQNPTVGGLWSDGSFSEIYLGADVQTLTINQQEFGTFRGDFYGDAYAWKLIKTGAETLRLDDTYIWTDGISDGQGNNIGLDIQQGTVVFANGSRLYDSNETYSTAIRISGGTLATDGDTYISNPIVVASGGRLAGFGNYDHSVSIGAGAILSPGLPGAPTGSMHFDHLELDAGGILEFNVMDPDPTNPLGQDRVNVYGLATLVINASPGDPFTIRVISLGADGEPGTLTGVDQDHGIYSWVLFDYDSLSIPGLEDIFDPSLFTLDLAGFSSDAPLGGDFALFQDGNHIMLGFTPVPEPSTYALMALGLGFVGWTVWRRRRQG